MSKSKRSITQEEWGKKYEKIFAKKEKKKDTMCILPWNHVYTNTDGMVGPCCVAKNIYRNYEPKALSISNHSVLEATNSKFMKQLRVDMMNGVENESCETCYYQESLGNQSVRWGKNNGFKLEEQRDKLLKNTKKASLRRKPRARAGRRSEGPKRRARKRS